MHRCFSMSGARCAPGSAPATDGSQVRLSKLRFLLGNLDGCQACFTRSSTPTEGCGWVKSAKLCPTARFFLCRFSLEFDPKVLQVHVQYYQTCFKSKTLELSRFQSSQPKFLGVFCVFVVISNKGFDFSHPMARWQQDLTSLGTRKLQLLNGSGDVDAWFWVNHANFSWRHRKSGLASGFIWEFSQVRM